MKSKFLFLAVLLALSSLYTSSIAQEHDTIKLDYTFFPPLCVGSATGQIDISITGGNAPYNLQVTNLSTYITYNRDCNHEVVSFYNLEKGMYNITCTDVNDSIAEVIFFLPSPVAVTSGVTNRSSSLYDATYDIQCYGELGWIEVKGTSGQAPFTYEWFAEGDLVNPISTSSLLSNRPAGNYYCKVTDDNGCIEEGYDEAINAREITQPDSIVIEKMNPQYTGNWDISCFGEANGTLDLQYTGGHIHQYKNDFLWNGPGVIGHTDSIKVETLIAGVYTVGVTDKYGCTGTFTDTLKQPDTLQTSWSKENCECYDSSDGGLSLLDTWGGTEPYSYSWGHGSLDGVTRMANLVPGDYSVTVTDYNGCAVVNTITITGPDTILLGPISGNENIEDNESHLYSLDITDNLLYDWTVQGGKVLSGQGTSEVEVQWEETETPGETGLVTVHVGECFLSDTVTLTVLLPSSVAIEPGVISNLKVYPNPVAGLLYISGTETSKVEILDASGRAVFSSQEIPTDVSGLSPGVYTARIFSPGSDQVTHRRILKL